MASHLPGALGPPIYTKTCLYTLTPDRDFVVDRLPEAPGVIVALGAAHGFKFASVLGRIMAELLRRRRRPRRPAISTDSGSIDRSCSRPTPRPPGWSDPDLAHGTGRRLRRTSFCATVPQVSGGGGPHQKETSYATALACPDGARPRRGSDRGCGPRPRHRRSRGRSADPADRHDPDGRGTQPVGRHRRGRLRDHDPQLRHARRVRPGRRAGTRVRRVVDAIGRRADLDVQDPARHEVV